MPGDAGGCLTPGEREHSGVYAGASCNERLLRVDSAGGQSSFAWDERVCRIPQTHNVVNVPTRCLDESDGLWAVEGQLEGLTASTPSELLDTQLSVMLCSPGIARRIEVNGEPTADGTHFPQELKLAPNNVLAQVHREAFKDEDSAGSDGSNP